MADLAQLGIAITSSGVEQANAGLDALVIRSDAAAKAADNLSKSYVTNMDRVAAAVKLAQMPTISGGSDYAARAADVAAYGKQLDDLRAKYDPLFAASQNYKAALTGINQAASVGAISEKVRAAAVMDTKVAFVQQVNALKGVRDSTDSATVSAKKLSEAHAGMSTQAMSAFHSVRSMAEGLAMGMPPTQVLTQQLNHLSYAASGPGGITGAFKEVGGILGSLITPTTAAIAGTVALAAAAAALALQYDKVQVSSQKALIGAGSRTGTSVNDLNSFTAQNASGLSGTGLSTKEARALGEDFTATGEIVISRLHGMSDAVVGFSNQTGKSMSDASKAMVAFAVDPQRGLDTLSQTYGAFDIATRKAVDALVQADDKTGAFQVVIDALADKSKKAADNMGFFEKATRGVVNVLAAETNKPSGLENQLDAARNRLNSAIEASTNTRKPEEAYAAGESIPKLSKDFEVLYAAMEKVKAQNLSADFNKLSTAADGADQAIIPQIQQIEQLKQKLGELERAKASGQTSKYGAAVDSAATVAIRNQIAALIDAQGQADRYNQRVAAISHSWGNVGQSVALTLQSMNNQLPVAQAWTESAKMLAQEQATYNSLIDQGKTSEEAAAVAAEQYQLSKAAAVANAQKLVQSSQDQVDLAKAAGTEQEAATRSAIAYRDAIQAGATATQAAAISANTLAASMAQAAQAAAQAEQQSAQQLNSQISGAVYNSQGALVDIKPGPQVSQFAAQEFAGFSSTGELGTNRNYNDLLRYQAMNEKPGVQGDVNSAYGSGDIVAAMNAVKSASNTSGADPAIASLMGQKGYDFNAIFGQQASTIDDKISQMDSLTQLQNAKTNDKGTQVSNLQGEMDWLQTLPETISRDQKIVSLQQSIDSLKNATDANTAATSATLNPLYSQGHGALAIGYYKAASGLDMVAHGPTSGDQVPFHAMVNGGERITITPPGASNDNSRSGGGTTVVQNFDMRGVSTNNARRSQRQFAQGFGQMAAAGN